jgi:hypothetical protein
MSLVVLLLRILASAACRILRDFQRFQGLFFGRKRAKIVQCCLLIRTIAQNTARQLDGVQIDKVFEDKASGKDMKRPQ